MFTGIAPPDDLRVITFSTYDCLLTLERIRAAFVILSDRWRFPREAPSQTPRRPNRPALSRTWERPLSPLVLCVASEKTRLRRADIELQRRVRRATPRRSPRPTDACPRHAA